MNSMISRTGFAAIFLALSAGPLLAIEVIISEIMYHPSAQKPEYVEVQNLTATPLDCADWRFSSGVDYTFPAFLDAAPLDTFLKPFERILIAPVDEATLRIAYPSIPAATRIFGTSSNALSNAGETIVLKDRNGITLSRVTFNDRAPWPIAADGTGHSLEVIHPDRLIDTPLNWQASVYPDGTPGEAPDTPSSLYGRLHISEVAFSSSNTVSWVEVYNSGDATVPATALWLASDNTLTNRVSLSGTIGPGQHASWEVPFPLDGDQATLFLLDYALNVYDAAVVERHDTRPYAQTYPDDSSEWYSSSTTTRDAANDPTRQSAVVINEVMADPVSGLRDGEYLELYNRSSAAVTLDGWSIQDAVRFTFPNGTQLAAGEYLVIAANRDFLLSTYGALPCLGNFDGQLSNDGDTIRLVDREGNLADQVAYRFEGDWPWLARGLGSSLELVHPDMDNSRSSAWVDSFEALKSTPQTYTVSGTYLDLNTDSGTYSGSNVRELHFFLVGDAYHILENIRFTRTGQTSDLILNGSSLSSDGTSATGWLRQGTHAGSSVSAGDLHLVADGHGDNRANRAEIDLLELNQGQSYTLTFDARWVYGKPRLIAQTWDHSVGNTFIVPPPDNLGSPGAVNSRYQATPAPQVDALLHHPTVPSDSEPVRVTARIHSADPLASVEVFHRMDNVNGNGTYVSSPMVDDGTQGDTTAGDGEYTATITAYQAHARIVQFYVKATTAAGQLCYLPRDPTNRPAMWLVDNRTTATDLRPMRFIISAYDRDALSTNGETAKFDFRYPRLSNHYFNMTMIAHERDVYYGGEIRKSGSPWTRSDNGTLDRGKWKVPRDRLFRGRKKFMFDNDASGGNRQKNRLVRYWLYLLGHPVNESEIVRHLVNTDNAAVREEVEPVAQDFINRNFPDGGRGELYRIDDEWWFADDWSRKSRNADWGYKNTEATLRYHTEWMSRSRETDYDYTTFINWTDIITGNAFTEADITRFADANLMAVHAAVRGYIYDWDSLTLNRGKNGYFYRKPDDGRFMLLHWDSDLAFRSSDTGKELIGNLSGVRNYFYKSYVKRLFDYYLGRIVDDLDHNSVRLNTYLQEESNATGSYDANTQNFLQFCSDRENRVRQELGSDYSAAFTVTTGNGSSVTTTNNTLSLSGTAPTTAFRVTVEGRPDAPLTWSSKTGWILDSLVLSEGANPLTIQTLDADDQVQQSRLFTVYKTGNAPPVADLDADPGSWNVDFTGDLTVDAGDSFDPEGTALSFAWTVTGPGTAILTLNNSEDRAEITFPIAGVYTLTLTLTDADGRVTTTVREIAAYNVSGFSSFNDTTLPAAWTPENLPLKDNGHPSTYYALNDRDGFLLLHMGREPARPLQYAGYQHPWLRRTLPGTHDWILQTKIELETRQFGSFRTGLLVELGETSQTNRYAFSLLDGHALELKLLRSNGTSATLKTAAWGGDLVTMRIRKEGNQLYWDTRAPDGTWTPFHHISVALDARGLRGGLFTATDTPQSLRTACDYLMLIDVNTAPSPYAGIGISEVMYDPPGGSDYEYLELVNLGVTTLDLIGLRFVDGDPFDELVLGSYLLAPGARALVVNDVPSMEARYGSGITSLIAGEWNGGKLSNSGERITLVDANSQVVLSFTYDVDGRWPSRATDEGGSSLEAIDPLGDLEDPTNWRASPEYLGSPGQAGETPRTDVVINELLTHTDVPQLDTIELHNTSGSPVDLGYWYLSDTSSDYRKFQIPPGTSIAPYGYVTFDESQFNPNGEWNPAAGTPGPQEFGLSSKGDELYLVQADAADNLLRFVDQEEFEAAANGVSFGRFINSVGLEYLPPQTALSLGATNAGPRVGPVVFTEVMYRPAAGGTEFVELQNISEYAVPLFHPAFPSNTWDITGLQFTFPTNITMGSREVILVVGGDPETFRTQYGLSPGLRIFGPFSGILQNDGETIKLRRPDQPDLGELDAPMINVDRLRYEALTPWPVEPNGLGPSLERVDPGAFADDPANWQATAWAGGTPGDTTLPAITPLIRADVLEIHVATPEFTDPADVSFQVWNHGINTLTFTISKDADWLSVSPAGGTSTGPSDTQGILVSFSAASLPGGVYEATLTITAPTAPNSPVEIPVSMTIEEPHIAVNPSSLIQYVASGDTAGSLYFQVWNDGSEITQLDYEISAGASWMSVLPASGSSQNESDAGTHELRFETSTLPTGTYLGTLTVTDQNNSAPNSPLQIPVMLNVAQVTAYTSPATDVGIGTATLHGSITNTFGRNAAVWFYYGPEDGGTNEADWASVVPVGVFGDGPVSKTVNNLWYGPAYKYRILARNSESQGWSPVSTAFTTVSPQTDTLKGLRVKAFDRDYGQSLLNPIQNLFNQTPQVDHVFTGSELKYEDFGDMDAHYPSLSRSRTFSLLWEGVFVIGTLDVGSWTLGTASDDGSVWYIDWNRDGDYADDGELVVDNNGNHSRQERTADATFTEAGCYPTVLAFYEDDGGETMEAKLKKGANLSYAELEFVDGSANSTQPLAQECPPTSLSLYNDYTDQVGLESAQAHAAFSGKDAVFTLEVLLGPNFGGVDESAWDRVVPVGVYTNTITSDLVASLDDLEPGTQYFCTFRARSAAETLWADSPPLLFTTAFQPQIVNLQILPDGTLKLTSTDREGGSLTLEHTTDLTQQMDTWEPLNVASNVFANGTNVIYFTAPEPDDHQFIRSNYDAD